MTEELHCSGRSMSTYEITSIRIQTTPIIFVVCFWIWEHTVTCPHQHAQWSLVWLLKTMEVPACIWPGTEASWATTRNVPVRKSQYFRTMRWTRPLRCEPFQWVIQRRADRTVPLFLRVLIKATTKGPSAVERVSGDSAPQILRARVNNYSKNGRSVFLLLVPTCWVTQCQNPENRNIFSNKQSECVGKSCQPCFTVFESSQNAT